MQDSIREIVNASTLPLSILIVGVGNDSFENMKVHVGDGCEIDLGWRRKAAQLQWSPSQARYRAVRSDAGRGNVPTGAHRSGFTGGNPESGHIVHVLEGNHPVEYEIDGNHPVECEIEFRISLFV